MELRNRETAAVLTERVFRQELYYVSLPKTLTDDTVDPFGYDIVRPSIPPATYSPYTKTVRDGVEQHEDDEWYERYVFETATDPADVAAIDAAAATSVRLERLRLLQETDWTQLGDVVSPAGYAEYRQALRDVPQQEGFPHQVTWPTLPTITRLEL